jgi:hypothetical protein
MAINGDAGKVPESVSLYGFDATLPGAPSWGDAQSGRNGVSMWPDNPGHGFLTEKQLLAKLMREQVWLGEPCAVKLNWPAIPEGV